MTFRTGSSGPGPVRPASVGETEQQRLVSGQTQPHTYPTNAAPSAMSAEIDGQQVHSNVHVGELQGEPTR